MRKLLCVAILSAVTLLAQRVDKKGGSSMTWPATPGATVCTGTPCTAWGTSITGLSQTLVGYLANVTSDIQAQLNAKQATLTGPMTQAVANSAANTVSVSVGTSGTAFAKTPVTIDPSTGAIAGGKIATAANADTATNGVTQTAANGTDNAVLLADGATGKLSKNSGIVIATAATASTIAERDASAGLSATRFTAVGLAYPVVTITHGGSAGSTEYHYCVIGTDLAGGTRSICKTTLTGNATLSGSNYNIVTIPAWSTTAPYVAPVGSCDVYRPSGGGSYGLIGTIATCAAGGNLHDTGLSGNSASLPGDTSGTVVSAGAQGPISVLAFGAKADGVTDDTSAIAAAVDYACTFVGYVGYPNSPPAIFFPATRYRYVMNGTVSTVCGGMKLYSDSKVQIFYGGSGSAFTLSNAISADFENIYFQGAWTADTWAIRVLASSTGLNVHHCSFIGFGDGTAMTGGGIRIDADSQWVNIGDNYFLSANGLMVTAPTDDLTFHHNLSGGTSCRTFDFSGGSGTAAIKIDHNNMYCSGYGAGRINSAGAWFLMYGNEYQNSGGALIDASSSAFEFLNASQIIARDNYGNVNSLNPYVYYIADTIENSMFDSNIGTYATTSVYRKGSGANNSYIDSVNGGASSIPGVTSPIVYSGVVTSGLSAAHGYTVIYTPTQTGLYRVTVNVATTRAGTAGCINIALEYDGGSGWVSSMYQNYYQNPYGGCASLTSTSASRQASATALVTVDANHYAIAYATTEIVAATGSPQYSVSAVVEKLY